MAEKILLTDVDAVLADLSVPVLNAVNQKTGENLKPSDLISWTFLYDFFLKKTGNKQIAEEITSFWFKPEIVRTAPPIPEAQKIINAFIDTGWIVVATTTRPPSNRKITFEWFEEHFRKIPRERVLIREVGSKLSGDEFKAFIHEMLEPTIYVDDNVDTHHTILKANGSSKTRHVLYPQFWNETYRKEISKNKDGLIVADWPGILAIATNELAGNNK